MKTPTLSFIDQALRGIRLPSDERPGVAPNDEPTEELVRWAIKFHVYSVIAHIRTVFAGLLTLADIGNTPSGNILARHIFEWTAHACYLNEKLERLIRTHQWKAAFELLSQVNTGNSWAKNYGHYYHADLVPEGIKDPISVNTLVAAYAKYQKKQYGKSRTHDTYGLLSEHSHPNSACLIQYREFRGNSCIVVNPPGQSTFGGVNGFILEWLSFMQVLLALANEQAVRNNLISILETVAENR